MTEAARFWAVDLHVHTPASKDVLERQYGKATASDVVEAALTAGLDAIAITDHNTADWCDAVSEAAADTALVVMPGVEITTAEGHLLAIWEEGTSAQIIHECLVKLGIDGDIQGELDISAEVGFRDAAERVAESGGLAIAAHADQSKGLLELRVAAHVRQTLLSDHLAAIEIVEPTQAKVVQRKVKDSRELAFVRGSDTIQAGKPGHRLSAIGSRRTWIKASRPDLCGLRHAFLDPSLRLRIEEPVPFAHSYITSVAIDGGFLDGIEVDFSPDMNCLVGGTGTGKSLVIECIRFALDQQVDADIFPHIHQEVESRLIEALGDGSTVRIGIATGDGDKYIVTRPYVRGQDTDWTVRRYIDDENHVLLDCHPNDILKISAFSQGEALEYSREQVGRMALVDAALDLSEVEAEVTELIEQLEENSEQLLQQRQKVDKLHEELESKDALEQQLEELKQIFEDDMVKNQEAWEIDNSTIKGLITSLPKKFKFDLELVPEKEEPQVEDNRELIDEALHIIETLNITIREATAIIEAALEEARVQAKDVQKRWKKRYNSFEEELAKTLDSIPGKKSLGALRTQLAKIQRSLIKIKKTKKAIKEVERPELERLTEVREDILKQIMKLRQGRRDLRRKRIKELNRRTNGIVKLDLPKVSDRTAFRHQLSAIKVGSRVNEKVLDAIAQNIHPAQFAEAMWNGSYSDLVDSDIGVTLEVLGRLYTNISDKDLWVEVLNLQATDTPDRLEIKFKRENGSYAPIELLAHGQKCTAMIVVLLADGTMPVIIDQPEDALHAPWIEDHLVDRLRKLRGHRQYLFATRSPGIVVSADSEQIVTMHAIAGQGSIEASGSLERHDLNRLVLHHLEGGPQALTRRHRKLQPSLDY